VRVATAWLSAEPSPGDVRHAAQLLAFQAGVPVEPPLASPGRARRLMKRVVHLLIGWYVRLLSQQVAALGEATARLGLAVAERTERVRLGDRGLLRVDEPVLRVRRQLRPTMGEQASRSLS
jgi:hypothetical protein